MAEARDELADTVRVEGARILATLVRTVGSLQVAEDAVQEAVLAALRSWPRTGVPAQPLPAAPAEGAGGREVASVDAEPQLP